jgi:peptide/nickel transport system permease protein
MRWARSGRVIIGGLLLLVVLICAIAAPWLAPHDPNEQELLSILLPPAWMSGGEATFPLGTDSLGRCALSRLLFGARTALMVAICAAAGAGAIGFALAHVAGYLGGRADWLIGRAIEVWMSFPPVVLSLILMVGLGTGTDKVILAIVLVDWTRFCRVLRAEVRTVSRKDYVSAARLIGASHWQVLTGEVMPATLPLVITLVSLEMGIAVVVEAILSFVGLGVGANQPAWGQMIADARQNVAAAPIGLLLPMAAIFLCVAGFNVLGDGLRRSLDVRQTELRGA